MNMLMPSFRCTKFLVGLVVLFLYVTTAKSDGGGRMEISPYSLDENITFEKVNKLKESSCSSMTATVDSNGIKETLNNVGITWMKAGKQKGGIDYKLNGQTQGGQPVTIDFSEIHELLIVKIETEGAKIKAFLKVSVFPNISPEQLVNERPTYSKLKETYSKNFELWINISDRTKGDLYLIGKQKNLEKNAPPKRIQELENGSIMKFVYSGLEFDEQYNSWIGNGKGIWWAIPSVIRDSKYPYRRPATAD